MGSARSGGPACRQSFGGRSGTACGIVVKRPWLSFSWLALAALVVAAQHWVSQPWSAAAYPIAPIVALWLYNRATHGN
ncbi:hypothetical protein QF032_003271 [Streptomyces achromogenes]|nr:hypothetical protein [Streptomyces achromogenes]